MKVIIIYGGNSSEKEISIKTGIAVNKGLDGIFETKMLMVNDDYQIIKDYYSDGDIIFNGLHGGYGENGKIQSFFEDEKIKFIGSGSRACNLAIDKIKSKKIVESLDCSVPYGRIVEEFSDFQDFSTPFIVKPNEEGSSVGFSQIFHEKDFKEALKINRKHNRKLLAEEKIEGREITVPILDGKSLPIVEIIPHSKVYDYESKYVPGKTDYSVPAHIDADTTSKIVKFSEQIHSKIGCQHYSRIDYILSSDNKPYFLELNTYPGMTETSLFPKSAKSVGLSFQELMVKLVHLAKNDV
jgi:D-alanine-D-alanine ligase